MDTLFDMLDRIYTWSSDQAAQNILDTYTAQDHCVVNYLYFANAMKWRLLEHARDTHDEKYKSALKQWDFLLPDGIALQTVYKFSWSTDTVLHNLNGTDFLPFFLNFLRWKNKKIGLYIYGSKEEHSVAIQEYFQNKWYKVNYIINGYEELDRSDITTDPNEISLLLVGRGTPLQEIRTMENISYIKQKWLLVMNQWWTFDFLIWVEQRAPAWIVRSRVLETPWRVLTNPKKNFWKFFAMFGIIRYFFAQR